MNYNTIKIHMIKFIQKQQNIKERLKNSKMIYCKAKIKFKIKKIRYKVLLIKINIHSFYMVWFQAADYHQADGPAAAAGDSGS